MASKAQSPVLVLESNIIHAFENAHPEFLARLQHAVSAQLVLPKIALLMDLTSPTTPHATRKKAGTPAEIHLHVTYLEMLWAFIYSWMVLMEEGIMKPAMTLQFQPVNSHSDLLPGAERLLSWAESISTSYTAWPEGLPSPRRCATAAEQWYAEKANLAFQQAVALLIAHEWVHATSGHLQPGSPPLSGLDNIELEKDADNTAFDALVDHCSVDEEKLSLAWATISALLSSYYVVKSAPAVKQRRHPELHHRIQHLLDRLNLRDEKISAYFHELCAVVLRDVFADAAWSDPEDGYETSGQLLQATFDQLDQMLLNGSVPPPFRMVK